MSQHTMYMGPEINYHGAPFNPRMYNAYIPMNTVHPMFHNGIAINNPGMHFPGYPQPHFVNRMSYSFDGFGIPTDQNQIEPDEKQFPSEDDDEESDLAIDDEIRTEIDSHNISQAKSAAIDILPTKPWKIQRGQSPGRRSRNFGKVAINNDTNLSSSTDELLKLAGGGPLQKLRVTLPSYEDSPPSTPDSLQLRKNKDVDESPIDISQNGSNQISDDYNHVVQSFQNLTVNPPSSIIPIAQPPISQPIGSHLPHPIGTQQSPLIGPIVPPPPPIAPPQNMTSSSRVPQPICRYFAGGFCSLGERCNFAHIEHGFNTTGPILHKTRFKNGRIPIPASQYTNLKLEDCIGEIAPMCLDQHGCRYLQRQLDSRDPQVIKIIFDEVINHIVDLMSDPFGNYLCQKLIENCSDAQRIEIVKGVASDIVQISKNMHGTRAVQKLIEHLNSPEENKLIRKALKGSVVTLIEDLNGNHVIQKCLHKMEPNDNQFIYDAVARHCVQVSTHRHGCCVMQRCIDHATAQQKLQLVKEIKEAALSLVQDAFGNYVVQYALDLDIPNLGTELIMQLQSKLLILARQKFSSNVVEKCLKVGNSLCVTRVLRELMDEDPNPEVLNPLPSPHPEIIQQHLIELLQDSYGNYVIQTCLSEGSVKSIPEYVRMANLLSPYVHQLRNAPYIKRIHNLLILPTKPENDEFPNEETSDDSKYFRDSRGRGNNNGYYPNSQRFQRQ